MYAKNGRMTAHGTILFDADLEEVTKALKPRKEKFESKGIKSVRSRVTNIKPYVLPEYQKLTTEEFRDLLLLQYHLPRSARGRGHRRFHFQVA